MALVAADALLEKFGGDSLSELRRNLDSYVRAPERPRLSGEGAGGAMTAEGGAAPGGRAGGARRGGSRSARRLHGAGKSTVGPIVARALGWDFVDLDDEIARREGRPPADIIREQGVARFRRAWSRGLGATSSAARGSSWRRGAGGPPSRATWPRSTDAAFPSGCGSHRRRRWPESRARQRREPLLEGSDPSAAAEGLLRGRTAHYRRSDITIETEGRSPGEVARAILEHPLLVQANREER